MREIKILMMVLMALGLGACVKEVDFNGEQSDPLLVVNGMQKVGQPTRLCVEKSTFFMDAAKDCRVNDVAVDLYVNGVFMEALQVRDSMVTEMHIDWNSGDEVEVEELLYAFNYCEGQYLPCAGDKLRFEVRSSEFETATAEVTMPEAPHVISFDTVNFAYDTSAYELSVLQFALKLDDPQGTNYYNLFPRDALSGFTSSDPVFTDLMDFEVGELVGESNDYYGYGPYNVFPDTYFDGKTYSVSMKVSLWSYQFNEPFTLEVSCVDEHLYRYRTTYNAYNASNPESLLGMFTEPVQVYSNVRNGIGVVAAQSSSVIFTINITPDK